MTIDTLITAPAAADAGASTPSAAPVATPAAAAPTETTTTEAAAPAAGEQAPETTEAQAEEVAAPAGAPEKYEAFKAPESTVLDDRVMAQFSDAARELNLPQDKAQQMIDKMQPMIQQRQAEQLAAVREEWATAAKADKEYGGAQLNENMAHAQKAMTQFASPEFTKLLNESGLGNHPEVIRFMVKAGKAIGEDKIVTGGVPSSSNSSRTAAEILYPSPKS